MTTRSSRRATLGWALAAIAIGFLPGCQQLSPQQVESLQKKIAPKDSGSSGATDAVAPATASFSAGWASEADVDNAGIQRFVLRTALGKAYRAAWQINGMEPTSTQDLERAQVILFAPVSRTGRGMALADLEQAAAVKPDCISLDWTPSAIQVRLPYAGGAREGQAPEEFRVDLINWRKIHATSQQVNLNRSRPGASASEVRQELMADLLASVMFLFATDRQRFPNSLSELLEFVDLVPAGLGNPLQPQTPASVGDQLFEVHDGDHRVRWRVIEPGGQYRWKRGMHLDANFQPVASEVGKVRHLDPSLHMSNEGWRTIAIFRLHSS